MEKRAAVSELLEMKAGVQARRKDVVRCGSHLALLWVFSGMLGCGGVVRSVPVPEFPQVKQVSEAVRSGGPSDRANWHRVCSGMAKDTEDLVGCMKSSGYEFIPRAAMYPADECWRIRDGVYEDRLPQPFCFRQSRDEQ